MIKPTIQQIIIDYHLYYLVYIATWFVNYVDILTVYCSACTLNTSTQLPIHIKQRLSLQYFNQDYQCQNVGGIKYLIPYSHVYL